MDVLNVRRVLNLKKLIKCNMEVDLIEAEVKALKEGLISKEVFDNLMTLKSNKVPVAKRYTTLLVHVHETLQERLKQYELHISANPDTETTALAIQAVVEGPIEKHVLKNIASLNFQVPIEMKTRYLLISMQAALQNKLEYFESHLMAVHSVFTEYKEMWSKLDEYFKEGLILKSFLAPLLPCINENLQFNQEEVIERLTYEKDRLNHSASICCKIVLSNANVHQSNAILTLCPHHLSILNELLVSYSSKWKSIGVALNFQCQDLQTIEASPLLIPTAPKSYLIRLLQDWLLMTVKHTLPPTVDNLMKALSSQTVGLGALGSELQALLNKTARSFGDHTLNQPYSSTKVSLDAKGSSIIPIHNEIHIEESESTLLEVQATPCREDLSYSWLMKEKVRGFQQILYLHEADIAWDGDEISCKIKASSTDSLVVTVPITMHVSCPLDEFTPSLSSMYLRKPEVPEDTWPPTGSAQFINLAIIKQQKVNYGSEYARATIRGDIDDVLQDKETVNYAKMYDSLKSENQVTFIEGRPGSGKTTFVHKITHDWANNSSGGIRILLLVSLRVLNKIRNPNLSNILHLFRDLKVTSEVIEERDGKGVCFIFDGLDEFSPSDGDESIVYKIIDRSYLHKSTVVVASRPAALAKLRNKADRIVEVIGFLGNQIYEYFDHYPFSNATKPVKLKAYLSLHPNIFHMCYLPIHATMVAFLFEVMGEVPKTETEIYAHFTRFTLMRSILKNKELEPNAGDNMLQCLNEEEKHHFKQICLLALEKTLSNKQVLHHKEISFFFQVTKKDDISLGLITIDRIADLYGFKDVYTFLHLTFQEYLAAYHISTLCNDEQMKLIKEHGHKNHMLVVWKFFCGLIDIRPFDNKFKSILHETQGKTLYHFQCAYESQQKLVCVQLLKAVHYDIQLANKFLSTPDFTAIGYVANKTLLPLTLSLINCDIDIVAIKALLSEMGDTSRQSLENLHVEAKGLNSELISKLLANFQGLKSLSLVKQSKYKYYVSLKSSNPLPALTRCEDFSVLEKIKTLTLKGFQDLSSDFQMIMHALRQCQNLTELNMTHNIICKLGTKYLSQSLPHCRSLERIDISENEMSHDDVQTIICSIKELKIKCIRGIFSQSQILIPSSVHHRDAFLKYLKPFTNLQSLDIVVSSMRDVDLFMQCSKGWKNLKELKIVAELQDTQSLAVAVSRGLQLYFHNIEMLILKNVVYSLETTRSIAKSLQQCPNLKHLDLNGNLPTLKQLETLLCINFLRLEELYLDMNNIDDDKISLLCSHLKSFQSLKILSLHHNSFTSYGAEALAAELHHCTKLVKLDLHGNLIDNFAALAVAAGLKLCINFQLLCLSRMNCEHFASKFALHKDGQDRKRIFGCDTIKFSL